MNRKSQKYGRMAGIVLGFAVWGCMAVYANVSVYRQQEIQVQAESPSLNLHAVSAVLMDGDSGRVLYEKDGDKVRPMASTTKIMTCIVALENGNLSDICTFSKRAASQPNVRLGVPKGTQICLEDLLYSLMLESHNDSAVAIAEHIAGNVETFVGMMNQKARDLGCSHTWFITPNGLDAAVTMSDGTEKIHSTTAAELAKIMRYCISESPMSGKFLEITQTASRTFSDISGAYHYSCVNHNALLTMMDGAISGKTGFTGGAGYSYVGAVEDEDRTFIIALLGCGWPPHKTYKWEDARKLFRYGAEHFHYQDIYQEPEQILLPVENGIPGKHGTAVELTTGLQESEKRFPYLLADKEHVHTEIYLPDSIEAPVESGELVGAVRYLLDGRLIRLDPLYTKEDMKKADIPYRIRHFLETWMPWT
ncbi:MAG: D-alanyl-D-alanine carboxypeptidase family protein [Brotaphodocola sp.]